MANAEWSVSEKVSLQIDDDLEHYRYDAGSDAYFDYVENRAEGGARFTVRLPASRGSGPRADRTEAER